MCCVNFSDCSFAFAFAESQPKKCCRQHANHSDVTEWWCASHGHYFEIRILFDPGEGNRTKNLCTNSWNSITGNSAGGRGCIPIGARSTCVRKCSIQTSAKIFTQTKHNNRRCRRRCRHCRPSFAMGWEIKSDMRLKTMTHAFILVKNYGIFFICHWTLNQSHDNGDKVWPPIPMCVGLVGARCCEVSAYRVCLCVSITAKKHIIFIAAIRLLFSFCSTHPLPHYLSLHQIYTL